MESIEFSNGLNDLTAVSRIRTDQLVPDSPVQALNEFSQLNVLPKYRLRVLNTNNGNNENVENSKEKLTNDDETSKIVLTQPKSAEDFEKALRLIKNERFESNCTKKRRLKTKRVIGNATNVLNFYRTVDIYFGAYLSVIRKLETEMTQLQNSLSSGNYLPDFPVQDLENKIDDFLHKMDHVMCDISFYLDVGETLSVPARRAHWILRELINNVSNFAEDDQLQMISDHAKVLFEFTQAISKTEMIITKYEKNCELLKAEILSYWHIN